MSLAAVGSITIPDRALTHPYVGYAHALSRVFAIDPERVERVIGTNNKQQTLSVQLYGWGPNVQPHRDDTGFIYFAPMIVERTSVHTRRDTVELKRGTVYRLYDFAEHWTLDTAPVVCAFIGPYHFPLDAEALVMLQDGVDALARRARWAPQVRESFRLPRRGEVYAYRHDVDGTELVDLANARANGWLIARCELCERFAVRVDKFFPMYADLNRCARCICEARAVPHGTSVVELEAA